ncbi:MAG TPA: metal-sulfur cluster assembly factor [Motilibacteraceae bacterium]|nr:metal-sulfur cluster assembly factor [Motilibacteraceae bacterium]
MLVPELLTAAPTEETVTELLREVIDPEVGINIVDLGLLRNVAVAPGGSVRVVTTLTTPACPLGPYIVGEIRDLLLQVAEVRDVDVEIVWSPPWEPDRDMSEHAKDLLGWRR